ncbi:pilus assembly FimT family protein [Congregibacter sp.]|uniref:pilus assembly FimT family protein n=1 Tax=Congregibacter sp. TaxID=2744308 RepID=UPI003F6B6E9A
MKPALGFSLIEMLVVLFVIVLMTSLVTLNVNSGASDRVVQERLESLTAVAAYALDEAQFSGTDFGVLFVSGVNERGEPIVTALWRQRLIQGWREPEQSRDIFAALEFPADVRLQITLDDVELLPAPADTADPRAGTTPQWFLSASGETQAGELLIRHRDSDEQLWRLVWDPLGRFEQFRGDSDEVLGGYAVAP